MNLPYFMQFFLAWISSFGFAILFNCPRKELFACGVCGGFAWVIYTFIYLSTINEPFGVFVGAVAAAALSRIFSYRHKAPSTVFLIPGVIPLVPGSQMYSTMKAVLSINIYDTFLEAIKALQFAGLIALAIILIFSLPYKYFEVGKQRD